ncbi:hypothetical protein BST81_16765 [Leptolyngbya sp. 'hensonii']|uniref:helix-turn-helix transcriptional regulator n=1 Tax=Leptolyngbya sp. 'hensonii' TaxID=1922337 RepID=UPI00094F88B7|nr:WYL domain-containing protein [Leptolyngbya sp. 'hensonii']OLP17442.1 hypothetical protein BST81_16765 [Leptolyngbya sp. 'hensonii']
MAKKPSIHPYADRSSFERLLVLIATFVQYPGIGADNPTKPTEDTTHDALQPVKTRMYEIAQSLQITLPDYSTHTLRKDLVTLRHHGILEKRTYRSGYYLGTGVMARTELRIALNALQSQAKYQQDPQITQIYQALVRRLGALKLEEDFFYPVRTHINHSIVPTDLETMIRKGKSRFTLFDSLEQVEAAILQGQAIEIDRQRNPYQKQNLGKLPVWPLQLVYCDVAWYLLYEDCRTAGLAFSRIDRFTDHCRLLEPQRSLSLQLEKLQAAHRLRERGWGLFLGNPEEQQQELQGNATLIPVQVRFFDNMVDFILEGEQRHPSQTLIPSATKLNGRPEYVDYQVRLPERSLNEFSHWVNKHMHHALVLAPQELVEKHYQAALKLVQNYRSLSEPMAYSNGAETFLSESPLPEIPTPGWPASSSA